MSLLDSLFHGGARSYEEAFGALDATSPRMKRAIAEWAHLYFNDLPVDGEDPCQQIPYTIVYKLYKAAFGEYQAEAKDPFAQQVLDALDEERGELFQQALIGGECYIKPFPFAQGFGFSAVGRGNLLVFGRDAKGRPTDVGSAEKQKDGRYYYTLLERRTVGTDGLLTIRNRLYRADTDGVLGSPVPLRALPRYAALPEEYTYPEPVGLGMVRMKTPMANNVDGSPDGVSVYAAAVGLIHNINRNEYQINGEFARGQSRILASADLVRTDGQGRRALEDHLFTTLDDDPGNVPITIFSPALREQSFLNRKREYLRDVENVIGLKRGLLSEVEAAERTAKEITSSEGDYNLTLIDLQRMWERAVRETAVLCGRLGRLYQVPGAREIDPDSLAIGWGNGILYDEERVWADYKGMVAAGLLKPEIAVGWYFDLPAETPEQQEYIRQRYMPGLADLDGGEA